jgi:hypothetical protein
MNYSSSSGSTTTPGQASESSRSKKPKIVERVDPLKPNLFSIISPDRYGVPGLLSFSTTVAEHLAQQGYSVCLVNPSVGSPLPHSEIVPHSLGIKGLFVMHTTNRTSVLRACADFDYVIVDDTGRDSDALMPVKYVGRIFWVEDSFSDHMTYWNSDYQESNKIYAICVNFSDSIVLTKLETGHIALASKTTGEVFDNYKILLTRIPTIALLNKHYTIDQVVDAMLGKEGSFSPFYATAQDVQKVQKLNNRYMNVMAGNGFGLLGMIAGAIFNLDPVYMFSLVAAVAGTFVGNAVIFHTSKKSTLKRKVSAEELSSDPQRAQIVHELLPPPIGITPGNRSIIPQVAKTETKSVHRSIWEKTLNSYVDIQNRWMDYELDLIKGLDAPLMLDYSCPTTADFISHYRIASDLHQAVQSDIDAGIPVDTSLKNDLMTAVNTMQLKFDIAERHALTRGLTDYGFDDQKKIKKGRKLFSIVLDDATSDHEKKSALKAAKAQLEGVIMIPERAYLQITSRLDV